jgi:hypothetical protein
MADLASAEAVAAALRGELSRAPMPTRTRARPRDRTGRPDRSAAAGRRLGSELDAIERDRVGFRRAGAADADLANHRRAVVAPVPAADLDLEAAVGAAERELADALSNSPLAFRVDGTCERPPPSDARSRSTQRRRPRVADSRGRTAGR